MKPKFSILTPTLNCESLISQTLDSIHSQSVRPELVEHVVIDGGSSDQTHEIVASQSPQTRWISAPKSNIYQAMNVGLAVANGEWIGWLNADDLFAPDALLSVLHTANQHDDADIIVGHYTMFTSHEDHESMALYRTTGDELECIRKGTMKRWFDVWVNPLAVFYRRSLLRDLRGWSDTFRIVGDWDLWFRAANRTPTVRVAHTSTVLGHFRMHDRSLSAGLHRERLFLEKMKVMRAWADNPNALEGVRQTARRMYRHDALALAALEASELPFWKRPSRVVQAALASRRLGPGLLADLASTVPTLAHETLSRTPGLKRFAERWWTRQGGPVHTLTSSEHQTERESRGLSRL